MEHTSEFTIRGNIVDIIHREIFQGEILIRDGIIADIVRREVEEKQYILPGFTDAHIHIESSMLTPVEFARMAVVQGTVAIVTDPHEIANVTGIAGVEFMIQNSRKSPMKFYFGAPSCVPATPFETSGAVIGPEEIRLLLNSGDIHFLSEMMNYPGVIYDDPDVHKKLEFAKMAGLPIDGHAPGLTGDQLKNYIAAGISTDHECFTLEEALEKINAGMIVQIREGSAAKNFETLHSLITSHTSSVMLCTDDSHPDDLATGHMNRIVKRAIQKGHSLFDVLTAATLNPVKHYNLPVGLLRIKDPADFILTDNPADLNILATYINGLCVAKNGIANSSLFQSCTEVLNVFNASPVSTSDLEVTVQGTEIEIIEVIDGELITLRKQIPVHQKEGTVLSFPADTGLNKICVYNRYTLGLKPVSGYIQGFGVEQGAIAGTIAHDSHNIICVGSDDESMAAAMNEIIRHQGGLCVHYNGKSYSLPLPVGGLMTNEPGLKVAETYHILEQEARKTGTKLRAPFMTLSFMALLVIPELKIGDKGMYDIRSLAYVPLFH